MRSRAEPGSCSSLSSATSARPPSFLLNGRPEGPPRSERLHDPWQRSRAKVRALRKLHDGGLDTRIEIWR